MCAHSKKKGCLNINYACILLLLCTHTALYLCIFFAAGHAVESAKINVNFYVSVNEGSLFLIIGDCSYCEMRLTPHTSLS